MGSMKQKCIDAIRAGGGLGFPIMDEDDYKGRLDRIEAALEAQYGWVMKEKESKSKKKKKDGKVSIWLSAALALVSGSFLCATYAAEQIVSRHIAGEGDDAVFEIEADQGDDAGDSLKLIMGADGEAALSLGGTEEVNISSTAVTLPSAIMDLSGGASPSTGGVKFPYQVHTAADTLTAADCIVVNDTTAESHIITLPDAATVLGHVFIITFTTDGGDLIVKTDQTDKFDDGTNDISTMADVGDVLIVVAASANLYSIIYNNGGALSN